MESDTIGRLVLDWTLLTHGEQVWVRQQGVNLRIGEVDAVTADGSVMWVSFGGASASKMFLRGDREEIRITAGVH